MPFGLKVDLLMATLHEILWDYTVSDLKSRLSLFKVKAKSQRKADVIKAIEEALSNDLKGALNALSELEKSAVVETCYEPDLIYRESKIKAKYGETPCFREVKERVKGEVFYSSFGGKLTQINTFVFSSRALRQEVVPSDLAAVVRLMIPEPDAVSVSGMEDLGEEDGVMVRETELEASNEVMALLRLADSGDLRMTNKTGMPTAGGKVKLLECLSNGDFYPSDVAFLKEKKSWQLEIGMIKPVGWGRLLDEGGLLGSAGTRSKLSAAGMKALSQPAHEVIRTLWKKWLTNNTFDEFNRIDEIKGQKSKGHMTAKPARRKVIAAALKQCPVETWVDVQQLSQFMQAQGFEFEVSGDLWKLYLCDREYGNLGYDGCGGWDTVQFRYLLVLLFEYAATLGLIDIAFVHPEAALDDFRGQWGSDDLEWLSRYDGLRAFRITRLGAWVFGMADKYEKTLPESSLQLSVSSDKTIRVVSGTTQSSDRMLLDTWAESISNDIWRLDSARARGAVERGQSADEFAIFLGKCDEQPLPETVLGFLKNSVKDGQALKNLGAAFIYQCRDADTAAMITSQKSLQSHCYRCGELELVVPEAHISKFKKTIKLLGLGIV